MASLARFWRCSADGKAALPSAARFAWFEIEAKSAWPRVYGFSDATKPETLRLLARRGKGRNIMHSESKWKSNQ